MTASSADLAKDSRRGWLLFAGVMLLTLLIRGGALWAMRERLNDDPDAYRQIAETLVRTGQYAMSVHVEEPAADFVEPSAYRPPLYPLVLSCLAMGGTLSPVAVAVLHLVLGVVTVSVVFHLGRL